MFENMMQNKVKTQICISLDEEDLIYINRIKKEQRIKTRSKVVRLMVKQFIKDNPLEEKQQGGNYEKKETK